MRSSWNARLGRAVLAGALATGGWLLADSGSAQAGDKVCGWLKYDTDGGPTSTATSIPYCETPCGSGFGVQSAEPTRVFDVYEEHFVCVRPFE